MVPFSARGYRSASIPKLARALLERGVGTWLRRVLVGLALYALVTEEPHWPTRARTSEPNQAGLAALPTRNTPAEFAGLDRSVASSADDLSIRKTSVCIGSRSWAMGKLGDVVLYRYRRIGNELRVGYFVYWSSERPWSNNALTLAVVPALAIDLVYSHFLFILPGLQRVLSGPGDIEGALIVYRNTHADELVVDSGIADDGLHRPVLLTELDLRTQRGEVALLSDVWSHQLGAHGAAAFSEANPASFHCFHGEALRPLDERIAKQFRLGTSVSARRAVPAWDANSLGTRDARSAHLPRDRGSSASATIPVGPEWRTTTL